MKLNEARIRAAKATDKDQMLSDGAGLYLRIRPGGSKKWVVRKKYNGKTSIMTLGAYPGISLKQARLKAAEMALKADLTSARVDELSEKYLREVVEPTHKRPELVRGYFDRAIIPSIGNKKVRDVTRVELVQLVQSYSKRGARTADQLRSNLKKLFGYAAELGFVDFNPMLDVTRRVAGYRPVARDRVLTNEEIRFLWKLDSPNARMLRFLLLTGLRIGEAQKGYQEETRWIVPERYSKNEKSHWVHLTDLCLEQLPLPKCTSTNIQAWLRRVLDKEGISPRFTPHDLRRTAATRMADAGVEPFIVERVLNHTLEGVMAVYNRAEYESERVRAANVLTTTVQGVISE